MIRISLLVLAIGAVVALATASLAAAPLTIPQQLAKTRATNRTLRLANADLQSQIDAQNATLADQGNQIARLQARIATWPAPVDVIAGESPDDQWAAMVAIWRSFPTLGGALCGYDRGNVPGDGVGLTLTSYSFYRWQGC